ncbi:MAG: translation elongation factor Ts [Candidatus Omnitrophota bacterium]|jgi:elongation factor Ts
MPSTEQDVKANLLKLREMTSAGMTDCRNALVEAQGDLKKAQEIIRIKGLDIAKKKSSRVAREGQIFSYIHTGSRLGVLLEINCESDFVGRNQIFQEFAKNVSMQIAAAHPLYVSSADMPADELEKEKAGLPEDVKKKPAEIQEKILQGKLAKRFEEVCLLNQKYIRDDSMTVQAYLSDTIAKLGENIIIRRFTRYEVGGSN